ncbi:MAG: glucosaminidase domain-containing protein [Archaeoglobaceae archaeon]
MNTKNDFINKFYASSMLVATLADPTNADIFARIMLAQSALETGWGRHIVANNMFGIKKLSWLDGSITAMTKEHIEDKMVQLRQSFQSFSDVTQSFVAYAILISQSPRYYKAWQKRSNPIEYFQELQRAGYATDPDYARKCIAVYNSLPLHRR